MGTTTIITILTAVVSALGIKEIWNIWKKKIDNDNKIKQKDEMTKDRLTAQVIGELKEEIMLLKVKVDALISENISLKEKLARMEERLTLSAKNNASRRKSQNKDNNG